MYVNLLLVADRLVKLGHADTSKSESLLRYKLNLLNWVFYERSISLRRLYAIDNSVRSVLLRRLTL
jgi:hypothetical protein